VLIELFSLGVTAEVLPESIGDFAPTGPVDPKFEVEGVVFSETRLDDLSYGIKI